MIHAIVYAKQNGTLDFHQATPNFPGECLPQIRQVCQRVGAAYGSAQREYALRYAPLRNYGMLQVMIRDHGNELDERRVHWNVVTYLLDEPETFHLFLLPFRTVQRNALALTGSLLRAPRGLPLPTDLGLRLLPQDEAPPQSAEGSIPIQALLGAAFYGRGSLKNDRLFIQTSGDPAPELERMLDALPPFLRRDVSFHTCICCPEDSHGISICCCAPPMLERLEASGFNGCEAGNIFFHYAADSGRRSRPDTRFEEKLNALLQMRNRVLRYDILQYAIRDRETCLALADIRLERNPLREFLRLLKDEDLEQALEIARILELEHLSQRELKQFLAASRGNPASRRKLKLLCRPGFHPDLLPAAGCAAALLSSIVLVCSAAGAPAPWKTIGASALAFPAGFLLRGIVPFPERKDSPRQH